MKKTWLLIFFLLSAMLSPLFVVTPIVGADDPSGEIIDGNGCYWENSWGILEAYPRVSTGEIHQEQLLNATWKLADNNLDVAFRFNDSLIDAHVYEWTGSEWNEITGAFKYTTYNNKHYYYVQNVHFEQYETRRFKLNYDVPFNSSGKWDFMAKLSSESIQYALDNNRYVMLDPAWYGDWLFSTKVTINAAQVEGDLLNFPVMYPMNASQSAKADSGNSVRFLDATNETVYYHERDNDDWNAAGTNIFWVNITSIDSAVDTIFYVFYGNGGASDSEDSDNTWDDNYLAVYHMNNESGTIPNSAVSGVDDLVCNYRSGPDEVTGIVGNALDYESSEGDGSLVALTNNYKSIGNITTEAWAKFETLAGNHGLIGYADQYGVAWGQQSWDWGYAYHVTTPTMQFQWSTGSGAGVSDHADAKGITTNKWYYLTATYEDAIAAKHYYNGTWQITDNTVTTQYQPTNCNLSVGYLHQWASGTSWMDGLLDEIRISNIIRNNSWMNTTHININRTTDFLTIGSELGAYPGFFTNETTNITRTTATFNAYLSSNGYNYDGTYTVGFWFGTNNPPTDADSNTTYGDITLSGTGLHFDLLNTTFVENTNYYVTAWAFNATTFFNTTAPNSFTTLRSPQAPTNVQSNMLDNNSLEITWTNGAATNRTVIIRKVGSYPSTPYDGTEVFNNSDNDHYEEDLTGNYYYRLWGWNGTYGEYSSGYADIPYGALIINCYDEDTNESLVFDVFISNEDGTQTYERTDATNTLQIDVEYCPLGEHIAIQISSANQYGNRTEVFTGYELTGNYSQNSSTTYVVLQYPPISKNYVNLTCSGGASNYYPSFTLDNDVITILPEASGEFDTITVIYQHEAYGSRVYYLDLYSNNIYLLNSYLPPSILKQPYLITVLDDYDLSISDVFVEFKRAIGGAFVTISSSYTDGAGSISINLIPGEFLKVFLSKTGYDDEIADWIPLPEISTQIFRLSLSEYSPDDWETVLDGISWTIEPESRYHNGSFTRWFNITSSDSKLEWFSMTVYWFNSSNMTWVLMNYTNISDQPSGGSLNYTYPNVTGKWKTEFWFKKQNFSAFELSQEGSFFDFISWGGLFTNPVFALIPDWVYVLIIVIIMMLVMAFLLPYAGVATGYIGIGIFGFGLALKPDLMMPGTDGTVSGWFVLIIMGLVYTIALFLWSRL